MHSLMDASNSRPLLPLENFRPTFSRKSLISAMLGSAAAIAPVHAQEATGDQVKQLEEVTVSAPGESAYQAPVKARNSQPHCWTLQNPSPPSRKKSSRIAVQPLWQMYCVQHRASRWVPAKAAPRQVTARSCEATKPVPTFSLTACATMPAAHMKHSTWRQ